MSFPGFTRAMKTATQALGIAIAAPMAAHAGTSCPAGIVTRGIDVSSLQGLIDWSAVAGAGFRFGIARATDGQLIDSRFAENWMGIGNAGLVRGAYDFFEPAQNATAQAATYLATVGAFGPGALRPILDVETTGGQSAAIITAGIAAWAASVLGATGQSPIIYTGAAFWNAIGNPQIAGADLWIAAWNVACPNIPTAWGTWVLWQNSSNGFLAGVPGVVDLDEFNGSSDQLLAYASVAVTPEPATLTLFAGGLIGIVGAGLRRRGKALRSARPSNRH
jgi:lysozyme